MYKKKLMFFAIIVLLMTGCTKITNDLDQVVGGVLTNDKIITNTVSSGYELYVPTGIIQVVDNEYNQKFKIKDRYVYLYVDIISYYYKNNANFKRKDNYDYYYKQLSFNDKSGYIGIDKVEDDLYFVECVYNYSKIEFYSNLDDLPIILANSLILEKSIKYNDVLIDAKLNTSVSEGREIKYELDSPKDTESKFSDYLQEHVPDEKEEVVLPDND